MLFGAYERHCVHWAVDGTPADFGHELLPDDLGRLEDNLARGDRRAALPRDRRHQAGDQRADDLLARSRAAARALSRAEELFLRLRRDDRLQPGRRHRPRHRRMDRRGRAQPRRLLLGRRPLRRMGRHAASPGPAPPITTRTVTKLPTPIRNMPPAGRSAPFPSMTGWPGRAPCSASTMATSIPLWYARGGETAVDRYGYGRGNWFASVGAECRAVAEAVGLFEISTFAKYEIRGPGGRRLARPAAGQSGARRPTVASCCRRC